MTTSRLPAIYYFKAGSKDTPEAYEGAKDAESLEAFLDEKVRKGSNVLVCHRRSCLSSLPLSWLVVVVVLLVLLVLPPQGPMGAAECAIYERVWL